MDIVLPVTLTLEWEMYDNYPTHRTTEPQDRTNGEEMHVPNFEMPGKSIKYPESTASCSPI